MSTPAPPKRQDQTYTVKDHPENLVHVYDRKKKRAKGQRKFLEAMER